MISLPYKISDFMENYWLGFLNEQNIDNIDMISFDISLQKDMVIRRGIFEKDQQQIMMIIFHNYVDFLKNTP